MAIYISLALIVVNSFTVYKYIFNTIFIDHSDFKESIRYSLTPNIISLFRREYWKDQVAEFKLGFFVMLCIISTVAEYFLVDSIIQKIIGR